MVALPLCLGIALGSGAPMLSGIIAGVVGVILAVGLGGRLAPAIALSWGLAWVAVARVSDSPESTVVAGTAAIAAVITLGSAVAVRWRRMKVSTPDEQVHVAPTHGEPPSRW